MKHASLFSGIGGFDYAAKLMGWENIFHCEINPFCQKVLKYHFPKSISYSNIKTTNFKIHANQIDILSGGFPCQPFSQAGKRRGSNDDRHLWPEMFRAIREIKPRWIVGENVRGIISWSNGLVFDEICINLEVEGYNVQTFIIPAAGVNAPHKRERVWFIAYSESRGTRRISNESKKKRTQFCDELFGECSRFYEHQRTFTDTNSNGLHKCNCKDEFQSIKNRINAFCNIKPCPFNGNITNSYRKRHEKQNITNLPIEKKRFYCEKDINCGLNSWSRFPTEPPVCPGNDGVSFKLDGITISKWRSESIKSAGNAIVPNVFMNICEAISEFERLSKF